MGFELFGLAKAEFRFKVNNFTKIKRGNIWDFVFFSVYPFFRFIRFRFKRVILYIFTKTIPVKLKTGQLCTRN